MNTSKRKVFFDSDVFLDFLENRLPFSNDAEQLFAMMYNGTIDVVTTSIVIANIYYIFNKKVDSKKVKTILNQLVDFIEIIPTSKKTILKALNSKNRDFEDDLQVFSCEEFKEVNFIITRNIKDYKKSPIKALTPSEFISILAA